MASMQQPPTPITSASSCGGIPALSEFWALLKSSRTAQTHTARDVAEVLEICRSSAELIERHMGRSIDGCQALEIGPGQWFGQYNYFATRCDVLGIDLDVVPVGFDPAGYLRMWRDNGVRRVLKTLGRKATGRDRMIWDEYRKQLGISRLPTPNIKRMDARKIELPDNSIDFVYSVNVFEHVPDPAAILTECIRVTKPGGVILTDLHLYTSDSGCHDLRIISRSRAGIPYWPHLRPAHEGLVKFGGYVNKIRLPQWREIFETTLPGGFMTFRQAEDDLALEASRLKSAGELADYSDDELLTNNVIYTWRKP